MIRQLRPFLLVACLLASGCGEEEVAGPQAPGIYVLDRPAYARALLEERVAQAGGVASRMPSVEERGRLVAAARRAAEGVSLRLDLADDGTFVVRYDFGREKGRLLGAWARRGGRLTLRTTHDAAGPVQRGAEVKAELDEDGIHFEGWPVPHAFTLRRLPSTSHSG